MTHYEGDVRSPGSARYAILASRWNPRIVDALVDGARRTFADHGVPAEAIDVIRVPGAWELPLAAAYAIDAKAYAGVVALGCVIRGDTRHYEHVADECARALMDVAVRTRTPIANGVLAVEKHEDAAARAGGSHGNKGEECALAIVEMANLFEKLA